MLEYRIVEKEQFTVMGKMRRFESETSYKKIPEFWNEFMKSSDREILCGMYGVCIGSDSKHFNYLIADNYNPCADVPDGLVTKVFPAGTWAVFLCRGALPDALQQVNTKIWSEWLPSCKAYKLAGNYNIEMYTPSCGNPEDNLSEIWIPIERV